MDELTRLKIEAAAFRGLVDHLRKRSDVQNIDIMRFFWWNVLTGHPDVEIEVQVGHFAVSRTSVDH